MTDDTTLKMMDLTMLLIYLSSWREDSRKEPEGYVDRAWRGYSFVTLNQLEKKRFIRQFSNSIVLTAKGMELGAKLDLLYQRRETEEKEMN